MSEVSIYGQVELPSVHIGKPHFRANDIAERYVKLGKYGEYYMDYDRDDFGRSRHSHHEYGFRSGIDFEVKRNDEYNRHYRDNVDEYIHIHDKQTRDKITKLVDEEISLLKDSIKFRADMMISKYVKLAQSSLEEQKSELEKEIIKTTSEAINQAKSIPAFMQEKVLMNLDEESKNNQVYEYLPTCKNVFEKSLIETVSRCKFLSTIASKITYSAKHQLEQYAFPFFLKTLKEINEGAFYSLLKILDRKEDAKQFHGHFDQHVGDISRAEADKMMSSLQNKIGGGSNTNSRRSSSNDDSLLGTVAAVAIGTSLFD